MPTSSKPIPSRFETIPTADNTMSASIISSPFLVFTVAFYVFALVSNFYKDAF
ncbi:MAG: hypothetical protein ACI8RH_000709, partial [Flavobacteriales bacterium]